MTITKPWTEADVNDLRDMAKRLPQKEIAIALGRSTEAIKSKMKALHIECTRPHLTKEPESDCFDWGQYRGGCVII